MKFSINQSELQKALSTVIKGTSTKSTIPILSGIYIEAKEDSLVFQATNLDLSIQYQTAALIEEPGKTVLPGKLISDIVKNMNEAAVHVTVNEDGAALVCDSSSFVIRTLDANDFPLFPEVEVQQQINVPFDLFSSMIKKVSRAASKDESKPALTGIYVTLENGILNMVTTDSYRLAVASSPVNNTEADNFQAIISSDFMADIASLPKTDDMLTLAFNENQIVVSYQETVFINRKIEGTYPAYKRIIPSSYATRIGVSRSQLISAVRRAGLMGNNGMSVKFEIDIPSHTLQISSTQDNGSLKETLSFEGEGESLEIGFNCAYVIDGLSSIDEDNVFLEVTSASKAGIFKAEGETSFLYLVMPMRV
jgi:DNA polymerase III subunit beta